jgi:hypothetical protein
LGGLAAVLQVIVDGRKRFCRDCKGMALTMIMRMSL